jgi:hypothetical protein
VFEIGVYQMSIASSQQTVLSGLAIKQSYDVRFRIAVAFVAIGVVVAICALAAHHGGGPAEIGLMTAFP